MHRHTVSFRNAFTGIWTALTTQANLRIHFFIGSAVLLAGAYFQVSHSEMVDLILVIALVVVAEMFNTSVETLADAVTLERHPLIRQAKDIAAGGVLLAAILSIIVALFIFLPKFV